MLGEGRDCRKGEGVLCTKAEDKSDRVDEGWEVGPDLLRFRPRWVRVRSSWARDGLGGVARGRCLTAG